MSAHPKAGFSATVEIQATPAQVAGLFWEMDAEQQADFFAALEAMAGIKLCVQMAAVVREIKDRSERGDHSAQNGFQTMLAHAQAYVEEATDYRVWAAERHIAGMVQEARQCT
jgi:hypothetical protein